MDEYLKPNASFIRMINEYKKHKSLVIGYDFDGTIHDFHKKGETYNQVCDLLEELKFIGCKLICWTAYKDHNYVLEYCKKYHIPCDGINTNGIPLPWESRKPFFNYLLDDRAGLKQQFNELSLLAYLVRNGLLKLD